MLTGTRNSDEQMRHDSEFRIAGPYLLGDREKAEIQCAGTERLPKGRYSYAHAQWLPTIPPPT